jgi:hypothetical protein
MQEKKRKAIQIGKEEVKLFLSVYLKDPKEATKIPLRHDKHFQQNSKIQNQHTK